MLTIWATYRNQDMTEGRGPMVLDSVFVHEADANAYVMQQDGVMGRKPSQFGKDSWEGMGDWQVKPLTLLESLPEKDEEAQNNNLERAYAKLTQSERDAIEAHVRAALT